MQSSSGYIVHTVYDLQYYHRAAFAAQERFNRNAVNRLLGQAAPASLLGLEDDLVILSEAQRGSR